jgi:hypothetical protein
MVMLQLPLAYELTPLKQGERTVAAGLLTRVGSGDLVLMDKGFWSYACSGRCNARALVLRFA